MIDMIRFNFIGTIGIETIKEIRNSDGKLHDTSFTYNLGHSSLYLSSKAIKCQ